MRKLLAALISFCALNAFAQLPRTYLENIDQAKKYYSDKEFLKAAEFYSKAFFSNNDLGTMRDRYKAARCWAVAGVADSAFYQLNRIVNKGYGTYDAEYFEINNDTELSMLHSDARWKKLIGLVIENKEKAEAGQDKALVAILDTVYRDDQIYRKTYHEVEQKFGKFSVEVKEHLRAIAAKDSVNLIKVKGILDRYGWLGVDVVGSQGNSTFFLVIQHSNLATQEKYLPMLRDAVKQGNASLTNLAMLEDRIALHKGAKQIYGTQIGQNMTTGRHYVLELENPEDVDKRRASVNLPPLKDYVSNWGINWSFEQYKKDLSENETDKKVY